MLAPAFATYAVTLNGAPVLPATRAAVVGGHVLLPIRALGEALGADVRWDAASRSVVIRRGGLSTTLLAGGSVIVAQGRAYAPLRTVAQTFGMTVDYRPAARTVALADAVRAVGSTVDAPTPRPANAIVVITGPGNGAQIEAPYPTLSARFAGVPGIDPASVRFVVDGRDVSADASVVGDQISYTPRSALVPGQHDVRVDARAIGGSQLIATWSFGDTFAFAPPPPPAPPPVRAIYLDRWVQPGTSNFDVIVRGAPGITGWVGIEGINGVFPLLVSSYGTYVAHVAVPPGLNVPFAHVSAQLTLPGGTPQNVMLPQTIPLLTAPGAADRKQLRPAPTATATATPRPSATPVLRRPLRVPRPTPTPRPSPSQ
ncbi:MAG TPA: copper amine oxidase N-terminal domain-containing protein [Candidatus Elarobacter sp.]|jgi:hypothetical protein